MAKLNLKARNRKVRIALLIALLCYLALGEPPKFILIACAILLLAVPNFLFVPYVWSEICGKETPNLRLLGVVYSAISLIGLGLLVYGTIRP